jgi:hypothetical protein
MRLALAAQREVGNVAGASDFKRRMHEAKRALKRAAQRAEAESHGSGEEVRHNVNVAHRANVVVGGNVGSRDSSRGVSSRQKVRIRQDDRESREKVETTTVDLSD